MVLACVMHVAINETETNFISKLNRNQYIYDRNNGKHEKWSPQYDNKINESDQAIANKKIQENKPHYQKPLKYIETKIEVGIYLDSGNSHRKSRNFLSQEQSYFVFYVCLAKHINAYFVTYGLWSIHDRMATVWRMPFNIQKGKQ